MKQINLFYFAAVGDVGDDLDGVNRYLENPAVLDMNEVFEAFPEVCRQGYINVVNRLLEIPFVLENATYRNNRALRVAAETDSYDVVDRLLKIPAVNELFQSDNSVLKNIVGAGDDEIPAGLAMVNFLLELGAGVLGDEPNELILLAIENEKHDIAIRLLQEKLIAEELMADRSPIEEHKDFFKEIDEQSISRIVAARILFNKFDGIESQFLANQLAPGETVTTTSSKYITNHILTFAYHDVLCGKTACLERKEEETIFTCPVINQFRNHALGAKARAQTKLGKQATTSTFTNSSTEPSKKARTS